MERLVAAAQATSASRCSPSVSGRVAPHAHPKGAADVTVHRGRARTSPRWGARPRALRGVRTCRVGEGEWALLELPPGRRGGPRRSTALGAALARRRRPCARTLAPDPEGSTTACDAGWNLLPGFRLVSARDLRLPARRPGRHDRGVARLPVMQVLRPRLRRAHARVPRPGVGRVQHTARALGRAAHMFVDDLFLASRLRVRSLRALLASGLRITWTCTARVDTVKPGCAGADEEGGVMGDQLRPRTGSNELLIAMDKAGPASSAPRERWAGRTRHGIRTKALFMLGYPADENDDTIRATRDSCAASRWTS